MASHRVLPGDVVEVEKEGGGLVFYRREKTRQAVVA
jgi:hypothetical protein